MVERCAERVEVTANVDVLRVARLLGGDVLRRADRRPIARERHVGGPLREPHVGQLHVAVFVDEDVAGFDVAMDHAALVGVVERLRHLLAHLQHVFFGEDAPFDEQRAQRLALDELHDEEVVTTLFAEVVARDDVRIVERSDDARLAAQPIDVATVARQRRLQDLQRHDAVELLVARLEHGPHRARADAVEDLVVGKWLREGHQWAPGCLAGLVVFGRSTRRTALGVERVFVQLALQGEA